MTNGLRPSSCWLRRPVREYKALANRHATASIATHIAAQASRNMDYSGFVSDVNRLTVKDIKDKTSMVPQSPRRWFGKDEEGDVWEARFFDTVCAWKAMGSFVLHGRNLEPRGV